MQQMVLVPASAHNKCLKTLSITKQELPKCQPSQNPTYQTDSLKKEINKKLFAKAALESTKLCLVFASSSQVHRLQYWMVSKLGFFLSDFAQQFFPQDGDVPDNYFISLDAPGISPTLIPNQNAKAEEKESWVPSKI